MPPLSSSRAIMVLGMHRNGTSVLTRGLNALGVHLGTDFLEANYANPTGYWENRVIVDINDRVLESLGMTWNSISIIRNGEWKDPALESLSREAAEYLKGHFSNHSLWGFKDPRAFRLLPFWRSIFHSLEVNDSYLVVIRNPLSVADSLRKRDGMTVVDSCLLWLLYMVPNLKRIRGRPFVVVDYDLLMDDPRKQLERIGKHLDIPSSEKTPSEIEHFASHLLDPDLRHTVFAADLLATVPDVGPICRDAYLCLQQLATDQVELDDAQFWSSWETIEDATELLTAQASSRRALALNREVILDEFRGRLGNFMGDFDEFNIFFQNLVRFPSTWEKRIHKNIPKWIRKLAERKQQRADIEFLRNADAFSSEWYRKTYPDVAKSTPDLLKHFVERGERLGFRPSPHFRVDKDVMRRYQRALFFGSFYAACLKERQKLSDRRFGLRQAASTAPAIGIPFSSRITYQMPTSTAVIYHCFYTDLIEELLVYLKNLPNGYFLYISTDTHAKKEEILRTLATHQLSTFEVRLCENRGRDIAPKLITFKDVYEKHEYFLHLHTKKSAHSPEYGEKWRRYLYSSLLGSGDIIRSIFQVMEQPGVGIVYPSYMDKFRIRSRWGANFDTAKALLGRLHIDVNKNVPFEFPAGSMFWGRSAALEPLLALRLTFEDFAEEAGQVDGTLPHAIERSICLVAQKAGFRSQQIMLKNHDIEGVKPIECLDSEDLPRAMARSLEIEERLRKLHFIKGLVGLNHK
jgi:hypothetical protein